MENFLVLLMFAMFGESITEIIGAIIPKFSKNYIAIIIAIVLTVLFKIDIFLLFGYTALNPYVAYILTGIILSRGSNYLHNLLDTLLTKV